MGLAVAISFDFLFANLRQTFLPLRYESHASTNESHAVSLKEYLPTTNEHVHNKFFQDYFLGTKYFKAINVFRNIENEYTQPFFFHSVSAPSLIFITTC